MKLRKVRIENVRSFLEPTELVLDGDISILIGPNGGGKTNLLDITIATVRRHLLTSWADQFSPTAEVPDRYEFRRNDRWGQTDLQPHSQAASGRRQVVEIELEVTNRDVDNIKVIKETAHDLSDFAEKQFRGSPIKDAVGWDISSITPGERLTYRVIDHVLVSPSTAQAKLFQSYLSIFEADSRLREKRGQGVLSTPMLSLPANRAATGFQSGVSLANYNEYDFKLAVDAATSRTTASPVTLAIGKLARNFRLLLERDSGNARSLFCSDPQIKSLTEVLAGLGYEWNLEAVNPMTNQYDVKITKQGSSFMVGSASSGEKELLTYLFAIYALNVRDALVVVDEPELHLHPKWQGILIGLFEKLAKETGNQFLLATHSPSFVSPASIQYVSRVFSEKQQSQIIRLNSKDLPDSKHLFSIVNSQNNEKIFFSDKVGLVEGISDRLVLEAILGKFRGKAAPAEICEIISVGGKNFFKVYQRLLGACRIPHVVIADLDYVNEIGSPDLKTLFTIHAKKVRRSVIENPTSKDGNVLIAAIDVAIKTGNMEGLEKIWEYINSRNRKLREDLSEQENDSLNSFIEVMRAKSVFILSRGTIEDYLPKGYQGKDVEKLIGFLNSETFWDDLPDFAQDEIRMVASSLCVDIPKPRMGFGLRSSIATLK